MIHKIIFSDKLYDFLKNSGQTQVVRSRIYKLDNRNDQESYRKLINTFKKWIFWSKPYVFENVNINQIYFDFERMISEYSVHSGIKSGSEIIENQLKPSSQKSIKSLEKFIEESLEEVNKYVEKSFDLNYSVFVNEVESSWNKSFVVNCVPNIINGNYVNIPIEYINIQQTNENMAEFSDNEDYFFRYLNRLPLKINNIKISNNTFCNIVNTSIVPLFISTGVEYYITKEL